LLDFYLVFKFSSLVAKSCGAVSDLYGNMLGVYRMVHHGLYKLEGGESYVYYSQKTNSWLIGCVAGHPYAWLRNCSSSPSPSTHSPPSLTGWQYRTGQDWLADTTFRLESCTEVETLEKLLHQTGV